MAVVREGVFCCQMLEIRLVGELSGHKGGYVGSIVAALMNIDSGNAVSLVSVGYVGIVWVAR